DLATTNGLATGNGTGLVSVLLGTGGGSFAPSLDFPTPRENRDFLLCDLNRDGSMDLAVTDYRSAIVSVFINTGCDPQHPGITGVFPNRGGDLGDITVAIYGCGIQTGATATLTRMGATIPGTTQEGSGEGVVRAVFDLTGRAQGVWDVQVTNPDNTRAILRARSPYRVAASLQQDLLQGGF